MSGFATPQKRSRASFEAISPYALRLPKFDLSGVYKEDEKLKNYHFQLQIIVSGCMKNPDMVPILYGKYCEAMKMEQVAHGWNQAGLFAYVQPRNVQAIPDEWIIEIIGKHSNLEEGWQGLLHLFGHDSIASVFQDGGRHVGQRCDEPALRCALEKPWPKA